jgi:hypothetical protein
MLLQRDWRDRVNIVELEEAMQLIFAIVFIVRKFVGAEDEPPLFPGLKFEKP